MGEWLRLMRPDEARRAAAWRFGAEAPGLDPTMWRVDHLCRLMRYQDFGQPGAAYGWTIRPLGVEMLYVGEIKGAIVDAPLSFSSLEREADRGGRLERRAGAAD